MRGHRVGLGFRGEALPGGRRWAPGALLPQPRSRPGEQGPFTGRHTPPCPSPLGTSLCIKYSRVCLQP